VGDYQTKKGYPEKMPSRRGGGNKEGEKIATGDLTELVTGRGSIL